MVRPNNQSNVPWIRRVDYISFPAANWREACWLKSPLELMAHNHGDTWWNGIWHVKSSIFLFTEGYPTTKIWHFTWYRWFTWRGRKTTPSHVFDPAAVVVVMVVVLVVVDVVVVDWAISQIQERKYGDLPTKDGGIMGYDHPIHPPVITGCKQPGGL